MILFFFKDTSTESGIHTYGYNRIAEAKLINITKKKYYLKTHTHQNTLTTITKNKRF